MNIRNIIVNNNIQSVTELYRRILRGEEVSELDMELSSIYI